MNEYEEVVAIIGQEALQGFMDKDELPDDLYDKLFEEYYVNCEDMPYGTKKARDGDPYQWMYDRLRMIVQDGASTF